MRTLTLPSKITASTPRQEVLRVWIDGGKLSVSLCHKFPESYTRAPSEVWPYFLSDITHHVADAITLKTGLDRAFILNPLKLNFENVLRSERGSRVGIVKEFTERRSELPDPDVSGDDHCVEVVRIVLLKDSVRIAVLVGMWLPDNEESVWADLVYDLTYIIAKSINTHDAEVVRDAMARKIISYIEKPTTEFSGHYYGKNDASGVQD